MRRGKTTPERWSYSAGERGVNRVRVFARDRDGKLYLDWYEGVAGQRPRQRRRLLAHSDREKAKAEAEQWAIKLRNGEIPRVEHSHPLDAPLQLQHPIRLGPLFDIYLREVTPGKARTDHDKTAAALFITLWGRDRIVDSLCQRDWQRFIDLRRSGKLAPAGRKKKGKKPLRPTPVRNRIIEHDLSLLMAVLNWATKQKDAVGRFWLDKNPLFGQKAPTEKNPRQPMISHEQYVALLAAATKVDGRLALALTLCRETGHRLNSVRQIRWSDIDMEARAITWRADSDKAGKEHKTPLTDEAIEALVTARKRTMTIGDGYLFPSRVSGAPLNSDRFHTLKRQACELAKLDLPEGAGFHSFRRMFATDLIDEDFAVLGPLGGWNDPDVVRSRYQKASIAVQREALARRRRTV